jgi:hypothetical protein
MLPVCRTKDLQTIVRNPGPFFQCVAWLTFNLLDLFAFLASEAAFFAKGLDRVTFTALIPYTSADLGRQSTLVRMRGSAKRIILRGI